MLERKAYFVTLDRIDVTTEEAILNCASRSLIPWRWAIQAKSVYAVQTSPFSFSNTSNRTGQSSFSPTKVRVRAHEADVAPVRRSRMPVPQPG